MSEISKDKDQKAGDEILRRMLKMPPKPNKTLSEKQPNKRQRVDKKNTRGDKKGDR